ncbi:hypothetical protein D3C87_1904490 [compost metagenome]
MKNIVKVKVMSPTVAWLRDHSSKDAPRMAACIATSIAPWMPPFSVPRTQVRRVRWRHLFTTRSSRASSRASAPKALTTALQLTASASAPPMRVSQALPRRAAGAT